jgi:protein-tyrosine phosphatase
MLVDIHCHCLPGLDDGPADMAGALALCRKLAVEGVGTVVATPHELGRYEGSNGAAEVRHAVACLRAQLAAEEIGLEVLAGAEVRVAEDLAALIEADTVMTLADGRRWILVEMSAGPFFDIGPVLGRLAEQGVGVVLVHPERQAWNDAAMGRMLRWRRSFGVLMQVTAGSLVGVFGPRAQRLSWQWLENGVVDVIASDAHDCAQRPPLLAAAWEAVSQRLGEAVVRRTLREVPGKLVAERSAGVPALIRG